MQTTKTEEDILIRIGVLALQGGFSEHISHLKAAAKCLLPSHRQLQIVEVRTLADLCGGSQRRGNGASDDEGKDLDGLIIPGGESTAMRIVLQQDAARTGKEAGGHQSQELLLFEALKEFVHVKKRPVFGTCAGLIMLANQVEGEPSLIGGLDVKVVRNYYGSQTQSFEAFVTVMRAELEGDTRMVFIRAPYIIDPMGSGCAENHDDDHTVIPLATFNDSVIAVQQGNIIATSFHPELTPDLRWHMYFLKLLLNKLY